MGITTKNSSTRSNEKWGSIRELDHSFLLSVFLLIGVGLVQVYSSSYIYATDTYNDGLFLFKKQALFAIGGMIVLGVVSLAPSKWIMRFGLFLFAGSMIGLMATLVPGIGVRVGGASRWISLPFGFRLEPSEFLKVGFIFFSMWAVLGWEKFGLIRRTGVLLFLALVTMLLIGQPDFGSLVICWTLFFSTLFLNGLKWRYVTLGFGTFAVVFSVLIYQAPYRLKRIHAFLNPWADPSGRGFQGIQSMLGYYNGGVTGAGLGKGQSKLFFLPEAHTDFTMSVFGEEWGFVGILFMLLLFGFVIFSMWRGSLRARSESHRLVLFGLTLYFAMQVLINFGVSMGVLPTKGLSLPFISYGGSSLISACILIGIYLNFQRSES